jgi:site-specific DNA-methyltransferase (adenine-specific)
VTVAFRATGRDGVERLYELAGVNTPARPGLSRIDAVWRTIAKAAIAREVDPSTPFVVLTSGTVRGGPMAAVVGEGRPVAQVVDVTGDDVIERLTGSAPH